MALTHKVNPMAPELRGYLASYSLSVMARESGGGENKTLGIEVNRKTLKAYYVVYVERGPNYDEKRLYRGRNLALAVKIYNQTV